MVPNQGKTPGHVTQLMESGQVNHQWQFSRASFCFVTRGIQRVLVASALLVPWDESVSELGVHMILYFQPKKRHEHHIFFS